MLTCVGYSVGLSNFWRFPYLAFHHGGGAFIVPYIIMAILIGKPIYFVEATLGQFTNKGVTAYWHCCPVARGLAFSMTLVTTIVAIYYNILMVYCLFYLFQTFREVLPWSDCLEWWGADENCYVRSSNVKLCNLKQVTSHGTNASGSKSAHWKGTLANCTNASQTAAEMFWERYVLEISEGIEAPGKLKLKLLTFLIVSWTLCYICVRRGIKSSEKVVHFTATIPYVVLMTLFIYGLTLQGSNHGLYHYFVPDWYRFFDLKIWGKALEQLFFSLSLGSGGLMTFSSYNKFQNPFDKDITFLVFLDTLTSIIGGVIVFSFVGSFAKKMNIDLSEVTKEGTDLCFVQLPEALSKLRLPQLWTFLFFSMLFSLGIDSQFGFMEITLTAITDSIPKTRRFKPYIAFALCFMCFCLGLPCITQGGQYLINLLDEYAAGIALTFIGLCELIIVMWIYGVENFCDDVETMIGHRPDGFVKLSWCYFTPLVLTGFLFAGFFKRTRLVYNNIMYPRWASTTGIFMSLLITGQIPGWAIYYMFKYRKDIRIAFSPTSQWGPADSEKRKEIQLRIHQKQKEFHSNYTDVVK